MHIHTAHKFLFDDLDVMLKVNSKNMKMHMSTHTGEKEECSLCGQWLRSVADHMRTVHKTGKQKPCTGVSCVFFFKTKLQEIVKF